MLDSLGRFIVFEGIDGSGKTTQAEILATAMGAELTRQPGGTPMGQELRKLLLESRAGKLDPKTEALLMAADRAEHVAKVVRPALEAGKDVICDRFTASSVAYQGFGSGLDPIEVARVSGWATDDLRVDLHVLVDVPVEVGSERVGEKRDRFEAEGLDFARRVADGFDLQANANPHSWMSVDGTLPIDEVAAIVKAGVSERLGVQFG